MNDRRDLGVGEEVLKALRIPVEEHPDPVVLIGIGHQGNTGARFTSEFDEPASVQLTMTADKTKAALKPRLRGL